MRAWAIDRTGWLHEVAKRPPNIDIFEHVRRNKAKKQAEIEALDRLWNTR
jgi:hypothetical protein